MTKTDPQPAAPGRLRGEASRTPALAHMTVEGFVVNRLGVRRWPAGERGGLFEHPPAAPPAKARASPWESTQPPSTSTYQPGCPSAAPCTRRNAPVFSGSTTARRSNGAAEPNSGGAKNSRAAPVTGWSKRQPRRVQADPAGTAPRRRACHPAPGHPAAAACTRIWCVRPVTGSASSSVTPACLESTRNRVSARSPPAARGRST